MVKTGSGSLSDLCRYLSKNSEMKSRTNESRPPHVINLLICTHPLYPQQFVRFYPSLLVCWCLCQTECGQVEVSWRISGVCLLGVKESGVSAGPTCSPSGPVRCVTVKQWEECDLCGDSPTCVTRTKHVR